MKRYKHNLSHYRLMTCGMGQLIPTACVEVLPGDTLQHHQEALIRMSPLNTPVMHPVVIRMHHFYVPNRTIWDGWEDFITGKDPELVPPMIKYPEQKTSLKHYLGAPVVEDNIPDAMLSLPVRAYNKIWNEYYRDQDLQPERDIERTDIARVAWAKDYFTTARPWTQKGDEIVLPIGDTAPVVTNDIPPQLRGLTSDDTYGLWGIAAQTEWHPNGSADPFNETEIFAFGNNTGLQADLSSATGVNINDVREAFALQRYNEARARWGSRYTEYLRYQGIRSSDARLQRPELLGGGNTQVNFSEVLQTAPESGGGPEDAGVGDLFGHGIAGYRGNKYRRFFEEHGYIISLMSVRPKSIYINGVPRQFLRKTKEDWFQKELQQIGQQAIYQDELYVDPANPRNQIFGYQDRYQEYKNHPSQVQGDFIDVLNMWHLGRNLPNDVALNDTFIQCNPSNRIFQIANTEQQMYCTINNHMVARRMVRRSGSSRIL